VNRDSECQLTLLTASPALVAALSRDLSHSLEHAAPRPQPGSDAAVAAAAAEKKQDGGRLRALGVRVLMPVLKWLL
jgi:hypothetical protein